MSECPNVRIQPIVRVNSPRCGSRATARGADSNPRHRASRRTTTMANATRRRKRRDDERDDDESDEKDARTTTTRTRTATTRKGGDEADARTRDGKKDADDDGAEDDGRDETLERGNSEYVGVRDEDAAALSRRYAENAEARLTRAGKDAETMSAEERERLTSEVMRYVLFASHQNRGAPVLRSKIGEAMSAIGGAGTKKGAGSYIVALAQKKFLDIFGFEMIELSRAQSRNKRPAKTVNESQAASAKCYALRSVLPAQMRRKFVDDPSATAARGFAIVVAALVQISNGCIREETLFEQLAQLGVVSGEHLSENHAELGDVRALMALLVKRRIFMREHSSYDDPTMGYSYELAEGAEAIIGYENIDKFVNESMRSQIATV